MSPTPLAPTLPPPVRQPSPFAESGTTRGPWGFWLTVVFGLGIAGTYIIIESAVVVVAALFEGCLMDHKAVEALAYNGLVLSICTLAGVPPAVGLCVLFAWLRRGIAVGEYLGLRRVSWKHLFLGLASIVLLGVSYDWISTALGRPEIPEFMVNAYRTAVFPPLLWVAVIVAAPVSEEIFFRGFLFKGFEHSAVGGAGAVLLTSCSWAAIHLQYDLYDISSIFILGLLLGIFRLKTGSLLPPLLMHVLTNLISTVQVALALG